MVLDSLFGKDQLPGYLAVRAPAGYQSSDLIFPRRKSLHACKLILTSDRRSGLQQKFTKSEQNEREELAAVVRIKNEGSGCQILLLVL